MAVDAWGCKMAEKNKQKVKTEGLTTSGRETQERGKILKSMLCVFCIFFCIYAAAPGHVSSV